MDALSPTWIPLCLLALGLGLRHGFDADHLATVDGITRCNAKDNPRLARSAGSLFALGHGIVVLVVAAAAARFAGEIQAPAWLEATGTVISIAFLFGLAVVNVRAVWVTPKHAIVAPAGFKGRLFQRFITVRKGWAVVAVGVLFALSFDAVSQAALFAAAAGSSGGVGGALLLGGLFVTGMTAVDGINGMWLTRLVRRADRTAAIASRIMALAVAAVSALIGTVNISRLVAPELDQWLDGRSMELSAVVIAIPLIAFSLAMANARLRMGRASR